MRKIKQLKLDDLDENQIKYMQYFDLELWERFKENLLLFIIIISKRVKLTITSLNKLAVFARKEHLLPFFTINLHHYGPNPLDITKALVELKSEGKIEEKMDNGVKNIIPLPPYSNHPSEIADKLGIALPTYERCLRNLIIRLGNFASVLSKRSVDYILSIIREKERYHYATDIRNKTKKKRELFIPFTGKTLILEDNIGIEVPILPLSLNIRICNNPIDKCKNKIENIIKQKEYLEDYTFFIEEIINNYKDTTKCKQIIGKTCLLAGRFISKINEGPDYAVLEFIDRAYHVERNIKIDVYIYKPDLKCNFEELFSNHYFLLGIIDELNGKLIIKCEALVLIEKIPEYIIRRASN